MAIKKQYEEIISFLESNSNKKVSTVLEELKQMCSTKSDRASDTLMYDEDGNLVAIFCYYHKKWELVSEIEYGIKKSTKSGFNTMCKEGVSHWNKQLNTLRKTKDLYTQQLLDDEITQDEFKELVTKLDQDRELINEHSLSEFCFDTKEEVMHAYTN